MPEVKTGRAKPSEDKNAQAKAEFAPATTEFSHSSHSSRVQSPNLARGNRKLGILIDYFKLSKYFYAEISSRHNNIMDDYDQVKQVSSLLWEIYLSKQPSSGGLYLKSHMVLLLLGFLLTINVDFLTATI